MWLVEGVMGLIAVLFLGGVIHSLLDQPWAGRALESDEEKLKYRLMCGDRDALNEATYQFADTVAQGWETEDQRRERIQARIHLNFK